jgi:hypothetical protein
MRARIVWQVGVSLAVAAWGCAAATPGATSTFVPLASGPPAVQSVSIPVTAEEKAPPVCPEGAAWEPERGDCVRYLAVQHPAMPELDLAHMPDPCGAGPATTDPGLSDCDPDAMGDASIARSAR